MVGGRRGGGGGGVRGGPVGRGGAGGWGEHDGVWTVEWGEQCRGVGGRGGGVIGTFRPMTLLRSSEILSCK